MVALEHSHPQFVFAAQDRYSLPLRDELQCKRNDVMEPCKHYVIKITDKSTLADAARPEIFFSGALHGDERVGPQTAIALADLLVSNAANVGGNAWLKRLVKTRIIVIMPTTNAYGYDQNTREELGVDPNRDFPYLSGYRCFRSMTTRAVNEVWRAHRFQLAITWYAGMESITYQWGSSNHVRGYDGKAEISADDEAQFALAIGLSRYDGKFQSGDKYYETGRMNDVVYAVEGGMEDWAYAGSWENNVTINRATPVGVCKPTNLGGYDVEKAVYGNATHRAFNILIETSDDKSPAEYRLGDNSSLTDEALAEYLPPNVSIGHVPRNLRLALFYIDIVQPYVVWTTNPTTGTTKTPVAFEWEVAGSITIDKTHLVISTRPDLANATTVTTAQSGVSRWFHPDMNKSVPADAIKSKGVFHEAIPFINPGVYFVQAHATVDQNWAQQPATPSPTVPPQTHIVNARTNDDWYFAANNKTVIGSTVWKSPIVQIVVQ